MSWLVTNKTINRGAPMKMGAGRRALVGVGAGHWEIDHLSRGALRVRRKGDAEGRENGWH